MAWHAIAESRDCKLYATDANRRAGQSDGLRKRDKKAASSSPECNAARARYERRRLHARHYTN